MRRAGLVVARTLREMSAAAAPGVSTGELDAIAREVLRAEGATSSFLHYDIGNGPFPAVICASVNERVVHGIPSTTEKLADGDVISLDFGAIVDGWHGDAAMTVPVGDGGRGVARLSAACERVAVGRPGRGSTRRPARRHLARGRVVGARVRPVRHRRPATAATASARHAHGRRTSSTTGEPARGRGCSPGMALAIEPMITLGSRATQELDDGWTVSTVDGSWAAHWEHTVAILADGPWVLTAEDGGRAELAARGVELSASAA